MRRASWRVLAWSAAVMAMGACASVQNPVPIEAGPAGFAVLAGKWDGEYSSQETGRSGSIVFSLVAGEDHAHGDVVMVPRGMNRPIMPATSPEAMTAGRANPELLTIDFVRVQGGGVSGALTPYRDPDCACTVTTRFLGQLMKGGTAIEGTYETTGAGLPRAAQGRWRVERRKS
jgi:hypothetical protein